MRKSLYSIAFLIVVQLTTACSQEPDVPSSENFRQLLIRDLHGYIKSKLKQDLQVEYELFRNGPTITGIAFPKYYAWVSLFRDRKLVEQGAVRLAAIRRTHFEVTDFLSQKQILTDPSSVSKIFPIALRDAIVARAQSPHAIPPLMN